MFDIAIIGAGPAGATLARLIGKSYKVLLIDKRELNDSGIRGGISKCCGGLVAPDAQKIIAELGLGLPQEVLVGPQLFAVRTIDLENSIERYYQRFYINIDRDKFDKWLVSLIPKEVDARFGCSFKTYERTENGFKLRLLKDGREYIENAKIMVGADGAFSILSRQTSGRRPLARSYISIQEWFEGQSLKPYFSAIFDREVTDFYSWTIPKGDVLIVGSAMHEGKDAISKFELLKRKLTDYGFELGNRVRKEGALILRPISAKHTLVGEAGIAYIGEAGGWISPSSAEGLSYAFKSALFLAQSLKPGLDGFLERYEKSTRSIRNNILVKNLKSPFMYNPIIRQTVMKSGIQSMDMQK
ncbi:MAG: FAD-binding protein [Clostridia bacterium]|nr:FAD-binding protein [Clostridia bacterium]